MESMCERNRSKFEFKRTHKEKKKKKDKKKKVVNFLKISRFSIHIQQFKMESIKKNSIVSVKKNS